MRSVGTGRRTRAALLATATLIWVLGLGFGLKKLFDYENTPAIPGTAPGTWPSESKIQRTPGLPTIVVMAHPRCPCTRATVGELALAMAKLQNRASATVVFVRPEGVAANWEITDLWRDAEKIPGVAVMNDPGGREAESFGSLASGQTMLYDASGRLLFSGGITAARGHFGDNAGRSTIVDLVLHGKSAVNSTPVFGCSLASPDRKTKLR